MAQYSSKMILNELPDNCLLQLCFSNSTTLEKEKDHSAANGKSLFIGTKTDLVEECLRKYVRKEIGWLMDCFRWASKTYFLNGQVTIEAAELYNYFGTLKSKGTFVIEKGKYFRHKGDKSWQIS